MSQKLRDPKKKSPECANIQGLDKVNVSNVTFNTVSNFEQSVKGLDKVQVFDEKPITDSLTVARIFGKHHYHVIRDIENLDCSKDFMCNHFWFYMNTVRMPNGGTRQEKRYRMDKDGFTFLVMGYRGSKAAAFKEDYINQFNAMSEALDLRKQSLTFQFAKLDVEIEKITQSLSAAGSFLSIGGKQLKPIMLEQLKALQAQIQMCLPFDGELIA